MRLRAYLLAVSAFFTLLAACGTTSARADCCITGGAASQQEALRCAYGALPACCRTSRTICVYLLDNRAMDACLRASSEGQGLRLANAAAVDGFYRGSSPTITLRAPSLTCDLSATFTHEYGHFVWSEVLKPAQRDQYRRIYDGQRSARRLISPYAAVSVEEGFAEAFCCYMRERPRLAERDALSCRFLSSVLICPQS